jgi:hypothetical protein
MTGIDDPYEEPDGAELRVVPGDPADPVATVLDLVRPATPDSTLRPAT